ncbi:uncharacterized protein LOC135390703 [Ornithodoros turicata]|uniref:uncharacterized protein LOC135390703 n=1 Tax=Ornithodoros turicata TaxID=34597 RepID=UPI0031389345
MSVLPKADETTDIKGVICVYLSSWNHVMGPQLLFCWRLECPRQVHDAEGDCPHYLKCHQYLENPEAFVLRNEAPQISQKAPTEGYVHSVLQIMHGCLERLQTRSCFLVLPDKRVAVQAVTFPLAGVPVSVAAIFPLHVLRDLWHLLTLNDLTLARLSLICQTSGKEFMKSISSATTLLNRYFELSESLLKTRTLDRRLSMNSLCKDNLPNDVTRRALQSHLQTRRCSIIMGDNVPQVDSVLNMMTSLLDHEELLCSSWDRHRHKPVPQYWPGLYLQGLVVGPPDGNRHGSASPLSARELLWAPHPSTVVDASQGRVWRSPLHVGFRGPLTRKLKTARTPVPESHVSIFVQQMLQVSGNDRAVEHVLLSFKQFLRVKAMALIKCASRSRRSMSTKYLQSALALPYLSDFEVVLAYAEKLRPGLCQYVVPST